MTAVPVIPRISTGDLTKDLDLSSTELQAVLDLAADVKSSPGEYRTALAGKSIAMLFEKPSLRTRMSFELAIQELGGFALINDGRIGMREPLKDMARNLERWFNGIVARTFFQKTIDDLARWSNVPVVNALSDLYHPCQALADMQTLREHFGVIRGLKFAFVGDGNNMATSLMIGAARLGMDFALATPPGYELEEKRVAEVRELAAVAGTSILVTHSPEEAAAGANVIYTDVWASMGAENEAAERRNDFSDYQV